jgi:hypothetical protein
MHPKNLAGVMIPALARAWAMKGIAISAASLNVTDVSSGRKIVEILKKNPKKDPSKYDKDDLAHMRKVAAYNKRHLAQEEKAKQDTDSNSYKSLKNWGHDAQKS